MLAWMSVVAMMTSSSRLDPGREGYGEGQDQKQSHQPVPSSVQQRKTPS